MPATALDPKTALVVIDLQKGISSLLPTPEPFRAVVANAARLADAFRAARLPVVLVTVTFSEDGGDKLTPRAEVQRTIPWSPDFAQVLPELGPKPGDILVTKRQPNAFYGTELDLQLRRRHVTGIVLAGVSTSVGVDGTARAAYERGYNLTFASDAMMDMDPAAHEFVMKKVFPRHGEIDTTDAVLALRPGLS
jgi:nicotinamidase-related amidase